MAESALELYDHAYNFHYLQNRPEEAARLYRQIIRHFPDSNESAYAAIQLEKLAASSIPLEEKKQSNAFLFALLALNLAATAALTGLVLDRVITFDSLFVHPAEQRAAVRVGSRSASAASGLTATETGWFGFSHDASGSNDVHTLDKGLQLDMGNPAGIIPECESPASAGVQSDRTETVQ